MSSSVEAGGKSHFLIVEEDIATALEAGGVGIWRWRVGSEELGWTRNLEQIHKLPVGSFDGTFASFAGDIDQSDFESVMRAVQEAVEKGGAYEIRYRNRPRDGSEPIWIEARGRVIESPDGHRYMTGICQNATDRIRAQRQLERRLRQQQAVSALGSFALAEESLPKILRRAVEVAAEILAVPLTKILELGSSADSLRLVEGIGWQEGLVGKASVGVDGDSQAGFTLMSGRPVIVHDLARESRFRGPQLLRDHGVVSGVSVVIAGDEGRPYGVFGIHAREHRRFDDADADFLLSISNIVASSVRQSQINERRRIVIREMAHRSGNMFQLVQSLFNQTIGSAQEDAAVQSFRTRLDSLARTNYLIAQDGWTQTRLKGVAETALAGFKDHIEMAGRDILLPAALGFDLSLVLHELATNSAKYGSLASKDSNVRLSWQLVSTSDGAELEIEWHDRGADTRFEPGTAGTGFGRRLISGLVERKWQGTVAVSRANGYLLSCRLPLPAVTPEFAPE